MYVVSCNAGIPVLEVYTLIYPAKPFVLSIQSATMG